MAKGTSKNRGRKTRKATRALCVMVPADEYKSLRKLLELVRDLATEDDILYAFLEKHGLTGVDE